MIMERILKTTTPTAKKEHTCAVCGQTIHKGERYLNVSILEDGKVRSRKTHFGCSEKKEPPKVHYTLPTSEQVFKQQVHDDTLKMLQTFTFRENMDIAFTPLIITEIAWIYAFKVTKYAADHRIPETIKLSRTVKMLRQKYIDECRKDLDYKHLQNLFDESERFLQTMAKDFLILWFSVNNDLKKEWSHLEFLDMRTDAYISIVMCEFLKEHNRRMDKIIEQKMGQSRPYKNPITEALEECMEAYVSPAKIDFSNHVRTSMGILRNNIGKIEYNVK